MAGPPRGRDPVVTNLNDGGPGSLREAIASAQDGDTISFSVNGTIALTNGELLINKDLKITGPGATNLAISAGGTSRVFEILSNVDVNLSGLTICDGHAADGAAGTSNNPVGSDGIDGGGIYNSGNLILTQCVLSNCVSGNGGAGLVMWPPTVEGTNWFGGMAGRGGAIYNTGKLSVKKCELISNRSGAGANGGGVYEYGTPGTPGGGGGAIFNGGSSAVEQCIISNCAAGNGGNAYMTLPAIFWRTNTTATNWIGGAGGDGGAIYNAGKLSVHDSSLVSNAAGAGGKGGGDGQFGTPGTSGGGGGAIYNAASMTIKGCVFEHNVAGNGGAAAPGAPLFAAPYQPIYTGAEPGGAGGDGGAICQAAQTTTVLSDCEFSFNSSGAGGAGSGVSRDVDPDYGGLGGGGGSGGAVWSAGPLRVNDCEFLLNQCGPGGLGGNAFRYGGDGGSAGAGGAIASLGELMLNHCLCASNQAGMGARGGNAWMEYSGAGASGGAGGAVFAGPSLQMNDCTFNGNAAGSGGNGGSVAPTYYYYPAPLSGGRGGAGGAIYCASDLTASRCTLENNQAGTGGVGGYDGYWNPGGSASPAGTNGGDGGAIFGRGNLSLYASTISGNKGGNGSSGGYGPDTFTNGYVNVAAMENAGAQPKFIYWEIGGGPGGAGGVGGIYSEGSLSMTLCTVSGNVGGAGGTGGASAGGFMDEGTPGANGGAGGPGGIFSSSSNALVLISCTVADNAGGAGGVGGKGSPYNLGSHISTGQGAGGLGGVGGILKTNDAASAVVVNTIIAGNIGGIGGIGGPTIYSVPTNGAPDLGGAFTSLGYNLVGQTDGGVGFTNGMNGDLVGSTNAPIDPVLGPLADNGGPTLTMALLHGSPALDAGDDALLQKPYSLKNDQRGFARKSGAHVDIGAFEFQFGNARGPMQGPVVSGALLGRGNAQANAASDVAHAGAGAGFQLSFSNNAPGATFTVLASSDVSAPVEKWSVVGQAVPMGAGFFQFTDATNAPQRFYRVSAP